MRYALLGINADLPPMQNVRRARIQVHFDYELGYKGCATRVIQLTCECLARPTECLEVSQ